MIDVRIRFGESPFLRVEREGRCHIFVNFLLQIDTRRAKRANDDIAARSSFRGNVAIGIRDVEVLLGVARRRFCLPDRALE